MEGRFNSPKASSPMEYDIWSTLNVMWPDRDQLMSFSSPSTPLTDKQQPLQRPRKSIDAFFTRDYNMAHPGKTKHVGVQGGFLVLRPSLETFAEFQSIIRVGDFQPSTGWGGKGYGPFYGAMTFQGIVPYYYDELHPGSAVELNRCVYNQMADNPRDQRTVNDVVAGKCRDGRGEDCEDCRNRNVKDVVTAHFTVCQKPWECLSHNQNRIQDRLCRKFFAAWYRVRADLEMSWKGRNLQQEEENKENGVVVVGPGTFDTETFRGFCSTSGGRGYIPIELPAAMEHTTEQV